MPWTDKNDATDWQAYFHTRNRLVMAALHSPYDIRSTLLKQGLKLSLRHLLSMEYSTVAIQQKAIEDFLAGPSKLFDSLRTGAAGDPASSASSTRTRRSSPSAREFPPPTFDMVRAEQMLTPPVNPATIASEGGQGAAAQPACAGGVNRGAPADQRAGDQRPVVPARQPGQRHRVQRRRQRRRVPQARPEGVPPADGARGPQLPPPVAEWPRMKKVYRDALPELTSVESWRKVFEANS